MRHEKDVGSSEYQIARLSTRIKQLTEHLKEHKTDHATYGVKLAAYDADQFATDTEKVWVWMAFGF